MSAQLRVGETNSKKRKTKHKEENHKEKGTRFEHMRGLGCIFIRKRYSHYKGKESPNEGKMTTLKREKKAPRITERTVPTLGGKNTTRRGRNCEANIMYNGFKRWRNNIHGRIIEGERHVCRQKNVKKNMFAARRKNDFKTHEKGWGEEKVDFSRRIKKKNGQEMHCRLGTAKGRSKKNALYGSYT